jgi:hypothetical protein
VPLSTALYGHTDAGGFWEEHCETQVLSIGYKRISEEWPGVYWHAEAKALLIVYVDDFKLAAKAGDHDRLWATIRGVIDMDAESLDGRFLGCSHNGRQGARFAQQPSVVSPTNERWSQPDRRRIDRRCGLLGPTL